MRSRRTCLHPTSGPGGGGNAPMTAGANARQIGNSDARSPVSLGLRSMVKRSPQLSCLGISQLASPPWKQFPASRRHSRADTRCSGLHISPTRGLGPNLFRDGGVPVRLRNQLLYHFNGVRRYSFSMTDCGNFRPKRTSGIRQ